MLSVNEFHRPKTGNSEEEYEDAFAWDEDMRTFAVADGATESSFSDLWAEALVSTFIENPPDFNRNDRDVMRELLRLARSKWYRSIDWDSLPWFQRNKAYLGSYSTLLGLQIGEGEDNRRFRCIVVGDSCMFKISGQRLESFPFADSRDMTNTPRLMWSGVGSPSGFERDVEIPGIEVKYGWLRKGDSVILATDALSRWILQHKTEKPWELLQKYSADLDSLISRLIAEGQIKNDDVTLISISIS
ncbi:MAG: protein phosphatase 2C domain-containing protein [Thermoplasmata archaeon]|uniref:Protein phosphatase 2C domain-containing protein n=1 Tax=Candidatus Sysuiplasma superficiale TaxID=2823368 RepID=A0A8J8CH49_9ARCH|nr:protein phosphatase 2C domain-containing protein [Candidatus Sysuiplasma superficiale]MBX8643553.1 protein phosphatase 2C domain-containing protein [Candidatus Sysuiplasma superficiale]MCL4346764.1 protein phosphatase 2C domain-containing protein [Candidatus Thermoplasmatota archaeon]